MTRRNRSEYIWISIHTPARGVTNVSRWWLCLHLHFNPHSRKGSDEQLSIVADNYIISIHTPARGVTDGESWSCWHDENFNPHSRKGSDNNSNEMNVVNILFQSTLPQGEWRWWYGELKSSYKFQSTLPQGEWHLYKHGYRRKLIISIHTPARGVTPTVGWISLLHLISIHTPARGVTLFSVAWLYSRMISIHTPARGVTPCGSDDYLHKITRYLAPARGVTPCGSDDIWEM